MYAHNNEFELCLHAQIKFKLLKGSQQSIKKKTPSTIFKTKMQRTVDQRETATSNNLLDRAHRKVIAGDRKKTYF